MKHFFADGGLRESNSYFTKCKVRTVLAATPCWSQGTLSKKKTSLFTQRSSYRVTPSGFLRLPRPSSRPTSKVAETLQAKLQPISLAAVLLKANKFTTSTKMLKRLQSVSGNRIILNLSNLPNFTEALHGTVCWKTKLYHYESSLIFLKSLHFALHFLNGFDDPMRYSSKPCPSFH